MNPKRVQAAAFVVAGLLIPLSLIGNEWLVRSKFAGIAFLVTAYVAVLAGVTGAVVLYKRERANPLPNWRRIPYASALALLSLLCLVPLLTWLIALSGIVVGGRAVVIALFVTNVAAAVMICFGRGWSRVGLVVVSYWILFLWMFPFALRE